MRKNIFTIIALLMLSIACSANRSLGVCNNLTGYIEVVSDFGLKRVEFPSCKETPIINKRDVDFFIRDFDILPDGSERIISGDPFKGEFIKKTMLSTDKARNLIIDYKHLMYPSFSPQGNDVAYLLRQYKRGQKRIMHHFHLALTDKKYSYSKLISNLPLNHFKPSWLPDGKRVVVSTLDFKIYIVNIRNKTMEKIINFGENAVVSNNGKWVAYLSKESNETMKKAYISYRNLTDIEFSNADDDKRKKLDEIGGYLRYFSIFLYDIETGENRKLTKEFNIEQSFVWSPDDKYIVFNDRRYVNEDIYILEIKTGKVDKIKGISGKVMAWRQ